MVDIEKRVTMAMENFTQGYSCSQSVVLAFSDIIGEDPEMLATISAPFGAGMGRLREVCGAVSGMFMVSGFVYKANQPATTPEYKAAKVANYQAVQDLARGFEEINGSVVCRELLGLSVKSECAVPEDRTSEYYKKRPCKELVGIATKLVAEMINNKK